MKLNVKRILAGLLAGALALSVTGCASSGESSSDASNTVSAGSSTSGTDEKTTIVFAEHVADVQNQAPQVWGCNPILYEGSPECGHRCSGYRGRRA